MKPVRFLHSGKPCLGIRRDQDVVAIHDWDPGLPETLEALLGTEDYRTKLDEVLRRAEGSAGHPIDKLTFLPPITRPDKIICVGLKYVDHALGSPYRDLPKHPVLFAHHISSFVGHDVPPVKPLDSDQLDWEGELVAIIGKAGRRIAKTDALAHVAGYSIANEGSIRDSQLMTPQWTIGKNFDHTGGFGPQPAALPQTRRCV